MVTGLKQWDAMSPILFKPALEKVMRVSLCLRNSRLANGDNSMISIGFADDLDIIGDSLTDTANASRESKEAPEKVGLTINPNKTELMALIDNDVDPQQTEGLT